MEREPRSRLGTLAIIALAVVAVYLGAGSLGGALASHEESSGDPWYAASDASSSLGPSDDSSGTPGLGDDPPKPIYGDYYPYSIKKIEPQGEYNVGVALPSNVTTANARVAIDKDSAARAPAPPANYESVADAYGIFLVNKQTRRFENGPFGAAITIEFPLPSGAQGVSDDDLAPAWYDRAGKQWRVIPKMPS